jgi:hypothetical protein
VQPTLHFESSTRVSAGGYLFPQKHSFPPIVPATLYPMAKHMSLAHLLLELNAGVELNVNSPIEEKQPCTVMTLSVGADDASSIPTLVAVAVAVPVVVVSAHTLEAASNAAAANTIVFIVSVVCAVE